MFSTTFDRGEYPMSSKYKNTSVTIIPLPGTVEELRQQYRMKRKLSYVDMLQPIHEKAYEDPNFRRYCASTCNEDSTEGRLDIDEMKAAEILRDIARQDDPRSVIAQLNIATIMNKHKYVKNRFNISPWQRRVVIAVPSPKDHWDKSGE
jgi:hypothetical protein